MSVAAMSWAWRQDIATNPKMVLLALADHADDEGICWPGLKGVMGKCGMTRRSVQRHIADLRKQGFVMVEDKKRADGSQTSNEYRLLMPLLSPPPTISVTQGRHPDALGRHERRPGVTPVTPLESSGNRHRTYVSVSNGIELVALFSEPEYRELHRLFPGLDLEYQAGKCMDWWNGQRKKLTKPKLAFKNWLERTTAFQQNGSAPSSKAKKQDYSVEKYQKEAAWLHSREEKR
jgi:biotin operon repressor